MSLSDMVELSRSINSLAADDNPYADRLVWEWFSKMKGFTYGYFAGVSKTFTEDETCTPEESAEHVRSLNDFINDLEDMIAGIEPKRLLSTFLLALNLELLVPGRGKHLLRGDPEINGHELGLVLKYCAKESWKDITRHFIPPLGAFLNQACKKLARAREGDFVAVKHYFMDITGVGGGMAGDSLLGKVLKESGFTAGNPLFDERVPVASRGTAGLRDAVLSIKERGDALLEKITALGGFDGDVIEGVKANPAFRDLAISYKELLNEYNCMAMALGNAGSPLSQGFMQHVQEGYVKKGMLVHLGQACVTEPVCSITGPDQWGEDCPLAPTSRDLKSTIQSKGTIQGYYKNGERDVEARMHQALGGHGQPGPPMDYQDCRTRRKPVSLEKLEVANKRFTNVFEDPGDPEQD